MGDARAAREVSALSEGRRSFLRLTAPVPGLLGRLARLLRPRELQASDICVAELLALRAEYRALLRGSEPRELTAALAGLDEDAAAAADRVDRALGCWAADWNLDAPWVRRYALATLRHWMREPGLAVRGWHLVLPNLASRNTLDPTEPVRSLRGLGAEVAEWSGPPLIAELRRAAEHAEAAEARLRADLAALREDEAAWNGEPLPPFPRRDRVELETDLRRLVRYRVVGESLRAIVESEPGGWGKYPKEPLARRLDRTAEWIGLPPRKRGRPPARS